jgi:hypothetical protein
MGKYDYNSAAIRVENQSEFLILSKSAGFKV